MTPETAREIAELATTTAQAIFDALSPTSPRELINAAEAAMAVHFASKRTVYFAVEAEAHKPQTSSHRQDASRRKRKSFKATH
jgi:hypothetical protein